MNIFLNRKREIIIGILIISNLLVWIAIYERRPSDKLTVYFLDVGQGDAILIDSPQNRKVLIDGGRNRKVLTELGKILPFAEKKIDVVIATHPDADHIGGLPEVINRYDVGMFIESGAISENTLDDELKKRLASRNIPEILAKTGMILNFGDGTKLLILFPNQDVSKWDTNDASVVVKLIYGDKSFLFTGDSTIRAENILLRLDYSILDSDVLKVGHHGSRTSTSLSYTEAVSPEYAVISAGKNNSYGHPHKEVLKILEKVGAKILGTVEFGTIKFETNGNILKLK